MTASPQADSSLPASTTPEKAEDLRSLNQLTRAAYTAYGQTVDFKSSTGASMPLYDELPVKVRKAWDNAVREVVAQLHT